MANEQMRDYWDVNGIDWVRDREIFDRLLAPYSAAVLAALAPAAGESVLDVGCGFGTTLAALVDVGCRPVGVDISTPMVEAARERVPGATVIVADVQTADLDVGAPFDAVVSRFGVMFFDDPAAAFANIAAATRPGGRLAFVCWRSMAENPMFMFGLPRLVAALPEPPAPPAPDAPGPCALADPDRVRRVLGSAGWSDVAVEPFDSAAVFGGDGRDPVDDAMANLMRHPLVRMLGEQVRGEERDAVLAALRSDFEGIVEDARITFPGAAWIVTAHRAG
jgi:SAM-dependent methyltransferase